MLTHIYIIWSYMNILKKTVHKIKTNNILYLNHSVFPYPPFQDYKWTVPENVTVKEIYGYSLGMEGSSREVRVEFSFTQSGNYEIELIEFQYGTGRFIPKKSQTIKIICEDNYADSSNNVDI
jgi:hypothetical protein